MESNDSKTQNTQTERLGVSMENVYKMFVQGKWIESESGKLIPVENPATEEIIGFVQKGTARDVDQAVKAAASVKKMYKHTTIEQRLELLHNIADEIEAVHEEIGKVLSMEQGKPYYTEGYYEAKGLYKEFHQAAEDLMRFNGKILPSAVGENKVYIEREADGVYAVITPWNYPLSMPMQYIAPGLATGNVIVYKPASYTPISSVLFVEALVKGIEKTGLSTDIFQFVTGSGGEVGNAMVSHPLVNGIGFTGENITGKNIVANAGLKKIILEMGGNGPEIVLEDADLKAAAEGAAAGILENAGQICCGTERIFVHRSVKDEFIGYLKKIFEEVKMGNPLDESTTMGPICNEPGVAKMEAQVKEAVEKGAVLVCGGKRAPQYGSKLFFEPTILDGVTKDMDVYKEETFGPIAPITVFDTEEEALEMANASIFGLTKCVYTQSIKKANYFVSRLECGFVTVNATTNYYERHIPFGGTTGSETGWGRVGGMFAMEQMTHTKTVVYGME